MGGGGLHPLTPLPLPLRLISLDLSSGEGGTGRGWWEEAQRVRAPTVQRWRVSLQGLCCPTSARLGGSGGDQPFPGCEDPLALPSGLGWAHSSPRHHHEDGASPQPGERGGCVCQGFTPPLLLGQDLNLVPRGDSHPRQPNSSAHSWGEGDRPRPGPLPSPVFGARVSAPRTEAGSDGGVPEGHSRRRCSSGTCTPVPGVAGGLRGGPGTVGEPAQEVARMLRG